MKFKACKYNNLKDNLPLLAKEGITEEKYDLFFYVCGGASGGTIITRKILRDYDDEDLACLVFHEDTHDNLNLPLNMEEAAAKIIGLVGALKFLKRDRNIRWRLNFEKYIAIDVDNCHKKLTDMASLYSEGKITLKEFMKWKQEAIMACCLSYDESMRSSAAICQCHTYFHYYTLLYYLFVALDCDLKKFIAVLRTAGELYPDPIELYIDDQNKLGPYFEETRRRELLIEKYLLKVILETK